MIRASTARLRLGAHLVSPGFAKPLTVVCAGWRGEVIFSNAECYRRGFRFPVFGGCTPVFAKWGPYTGSCWCLDGGHLQQKEKEERRHMSEEGSVSRCQVQPHQVAEIAGRGGRPRALLWSTGNMRCSCFGPRRMPGFLVGVISLALSCVHSCLSLLVCVFSLWSPPNNGF